MSFKKVLLPILVFALASCSNNPNKSSTTNSIADIPNSGGQIEASQSKKIVDELKTQAYLWALPAVSM